MASTPLSVSFANAANKATSLAPIFPLNPPIFDDTLPGMFGTYKQGIWLPIENIAVEFGATLDRTAILTPDIYDGPSTWSSDGIKTTQVYLTASGEWKDVNEGGYDQGSATLGVNFTSSSETLFHVASSDLVVYEMDEAVLDQITGKVEMRTDLADLRFVVKLIAATNLFLFGGVSHSASCIVSGALQALEDCVSGKFTGGLTIAKSNVTQIQASIQNETGFTPVGMVLMQFDAKTGWTVNNAPE